MHVTREIALSKRPKQAAYASALSQVTYQYTYLLSSFPVSVFIYHVLSEFHYIAHL